MFLELNHSRLGKQTYGVKFTRNGTTTRAELVRVDEIIGLDFTGLVGISSLYYKDRFVKSTGRKVALANLIERMQQVSAGDTEPEFTLTKEDRAKIWEAYFKSHKK
jgi:hypothetical protein